MVDSLGDTVAEDGLVTLREAIEAGEYERDRGGTPMREAGRRRDVITFSPEVWGGVIELEEGAIGDYGGGGNSGAVGWRD